VDAANDKLASGAANGVDNAISQVLSMKHAALSRHCPTSIPEATTLPDETWRADH
jgi:hypothetical protein